MPPSYNCEGYGECIDGLVFDDCCCVQGASFVRQIPDPMRNMDGSLARAVCGKCGSTRDL